MSETATAPKAAKPKKGKDEAPANPFALVGKPKNETLPTKDVLVFKTLQARKDCDEGQVVDVDRATGFAEKMKAGVKFPRIKCMEVSDAPGHKDEPVVVCWDGMHTHAGCELAKIETIDCAVWVGTWAMALSAAATVANREHDDKGKVLSTKEKVASVAILAKAFRDGKPKSEWPSNRALATLIGVSHQHVNNMDPFDRSPAGDTRGQKNAVKKADRAIANAEGPAVVRPGQIVVPVNQLDPVSKLPANFEIVKRTTGQADAKYHAKDKDEAIKRFQVDHPTWVLTEYVCREYTPDAASVADRMVAFGLMSGNPNATTAPAPGSVAKPPGFDWSTMQANLGYVTRGHDAMGDLFNLKADAEYKKAFAHLDLFTKWLDDAKKKHGKPKTKA